MEKHHEKHQKELVALGSRMQAVLEFPEPTALPEEWETVVAGQEAVLADPNYANLREHLPELVASFDEIAAAVKVQALQLRRLWDNIKEEAESRSGSTVCMEDPPPPGYEGLLRGFVDTLYEGTLAERFGV